MKRIVCAIALAGFVSFLAPVSLRADTPQSAKAIIRSGQGHGIAADVVDVKTGQLRNVATVFKSGEQFRLRFQTSIGGFLYLVNVAPSGARSQIFPQGTENNFFAAGAIEIPAAGQPPFEFDRETGVETIEVAISPSAIPAYENARHSPVLAPAGEVGIVLPLLPAATPQGRPVAGPGFGNNNAAKAIKRADGFTFGEPPPADQFFRFTMSLLHQ